MSRQINVSHSMKKAGKLFAARGSFGYLPAVPDSNDPYDFLLQPIKKTIRPNDNLSMRQLWKFREMPARIWEVFESLKTPSARSRNL
jgi:hypothetical protein